MGKIIQIEVPDWVDEKEIKTLIDNYIESKLPDKVTREEYIKLANINLEEIVEYPTEKELEFLKEMREKEKKRVQW